MKITVGKAANEGGIMVIVQGVAAVVLVMVIVVIMTADEMTLRGRDTAIGTSNTGSIKKAEVVCRLLWR